LSYQNTQLINKINTILVFIFILFLPTQLGRHFFLPFSYLSGVRIDYLAPTIYLTDILIILLIFFNLKTVLNFFRNRKLLFVLGLLLLNVILSLSPFISMYQYIDILKWLAVFSIFLKIGKKYLKEIYLAFFFGSIFQLILVILQFVNKHSIQGFYWFLGERFLNLSLPGVAKASISGVEFLRPYGTFSHPNSMGGFYLLIYFFFLMIPNINIKNIIWDLGNHQSLRSENKNLNIKLIDAYMFREGGLFICTLLIFLSFSKISILTLLFLTTIYLLLTTDKCKPCLLAKIIVLIIAGSIFLLSQNDPQSLNNRIILLKNSWQIFLAHPFFGVGLGNYLIAQNKLPMNFSYYFQQPVHNIFLLWLTETGIIINGAIIWLMVYPELDLRFGGLAEWAKWLRIKKLLITYYLLLITILITGSFDHYWLTLQQNFLLLAIIFSLLHSSNVIASPEGMTSSPEGMTSSPEGMTSSPEGTRQSHNH